MNIQRFTAATSREALAKARLAFGDGTLILSNRPTENGVEVVATAEDTLAALDQATANPCKSAIASAAVANTPPSYQEVASKVEDDAAQLAMSTLSFQDYVRERMLRKRHESTDVHHSAETRPKPSRCQAPTRRLWWNADGKEGAKTICKGHSSARKDCATPSLQT